MVTEDVMSTEPPKAQVEAWGGQYHVWLRRNAVEDELESGPDGEPVKCWRSELVYFAQGEPITAEEAEADLDALWAAHERDGEWEALTQHEKAVAIQAMRDQSGAQAEAMAAVFEATSASLTDAQASRMSAYAPEWAVGTSYAKGDVFAHGGKLWRVQQATTAQAQYEPGMAGLESLYAEVNYYHGYRVFDASTLSYDYANKGDVVAYDADGTWQLWESQRDGNTSTPGADEWYARREDLEASWRGSE